MTDHEWGDLGPIYEGALPVRGRRWKCARCGLTVRSNRRPFVPPSRDGSLYAAGPSGDFPAGSKDRYPADCDVAVVRAVMTS